MGNRCPFTSEFRFTDVPEKMVFCPLKEGEVVGKNGECTEQCILKGDMERENA